MVCKWRNCTKVALHLKMIGINMNWQRLNPLVGLLFQAVHSSFSFHFFLFFFFFFFNFLKFFSLHLIFFHFWSKFSFFFHFLTIMWQFHILSIGIPCPFSSAHTALVCVLGNEVYTCRTIDFWLHYWFLTISLLLR